MKDLTLKDANMSKAEVQKCGREAAGKALAEKSPSEVYVLACKLEEMAKAMKEAAKMDAIDMVDVEEKLSVYGTEVTAHSRMTWSYKHSPEWAEAKAELTRIEKSMKYAAEMFPKEVFDDEGTQIEPALRTPGAPFLKVTY